MGNLCGGNHQSLSDRKASRASSGGKGSKNSHRPPRNCTNGVKRLVKPRWKSQERLTKAELEEKRVVFWDTQPHYGGSKVIWDALKAAAEADLPTACLILESAGVIVAEEDMHVCYDERGCRYDLPVFVLSEPDNLAADSIPTIAEE